MAESQRRLTTDDVLVGLDLASTGHQVVILNAEGQRLTRFRIPHSRAGLDELLRRTMPSAWGRAAGRRSFAFEATGHLWEAIASRLTRDGEHYAVVNPLATFRMREARQLNRHKTDLTDAEQIAEFLRIGLVTRTRLEPPLYLTLRRAWGEYARLRGERARLKTLLTHQLYGFFPEFVTVWADVAEPGALAVLRTGLTPQEIAALSFSEFVTEVRRHQAGRRLWRFKLAQVYRYAQDTVVCPQGLSALAREVQRIVARFDQLTLQMAAATAEISVVLDQLEEPRYLRTIPGLGWTSIAGLLAHIGPIDKYKQGRQLIKLAGTNPGRHESGKTIPRGQAMTHRGRADLRGVVYMATLSCLQHNPRLRAHFDRLIQRPERPLSRMQALGACMNKLLRYAFAVMKRRQPFDLAHRWTAGGDCIA